MLQRTKMLEKFCPTLQHR